MGESGFSAQVNNSSIEKRSRGDEEHNNEHIGGNGSHSEGVADRKGGGVEGIAEVGEFRAAV